MENSTLTWKDLQLIRRLFDEYESEMLNSTPWDGIYHKDDYAFVLRKYYDLKTNYNKIEEQVRNATPIL